MKIEKALEDSLGLKFEKAPSTNTTITVKTTPSSNIVPYVDPKTQDEIDEEEDYKLARKTYRNLLEQGNTAIDMMQDIAADQENPRAYEVIATLIKTLADTTSNMYDIQEKRKKNRTVINNNSQNISVDKAVFVGSNLDLLKHMKEKMLEEDGDT